MPDFGGGAVQAEILSIGTELLLGEIVDTNAQYISSRLRDIGVNVYRRITVGTTLRGCWPLSRIPSGGRTSS